MECRKHMGDIEIPKILRCYVKKEGGHYFACCIDMCMGAQGDTIEEAKRNLNELVLAHIELAIPNLRPGEQLFKPAPVSFWLEYHYIWLLCNFMHCLRPNGENCSSNSEHQIFPCNTPALA